MENSNINKIRYSLETEYGNDGKQNVITEVHSFKSGHILNKYSPNEGVLTEMIYSGNLNILRNLDLKQQLSSYNQFLSKVKSREESIERRRLSFEQWIFDKVSLERILQDVGINKRLGLPEVLQNKPIENKYLFKLNAFKNQVIMLQSYSIYLDEGLTYL